MTDNPPVTTTDTHPLGIHARIVIVGLLVVGVVGLFIVVPLMVTFLALAAVNFLAFIILPLFRQPLAPILAILTAVFWVASLVYTEWGFSTPNPRIRISWFSFVPACLFQLVLISLPIWHPRRRSSDGRD